ncbi:MAG: YdcF family protein [Actinomycetota bacterium]|nr:YdcF family protein [Actinomycetota bacterium]
MFRWAFRSTAVILTGLLAYLAVTFVQVWRASRRDEARRAEAVVVFGAAQYNGEPSPVLQARLDHAADLFQRGFADRVVVTGGRRPGDRFTEATASARYLSRQGIADKSILRVVSGTNSWQSLASAANELKKRGLTNVLLVSDGFHSARISAMAEELGLLAHTSPSRASPIDGVEKLPYLGRETVAVAVGRVVGFRRISGIDRTVTRVRAEVRSG